MRSRLITALSVCICVTMALLVGGVVAHAESISDRVDLNSLDPNKTATIRIDYASAVADNPDALSALKSEPMIVSLYKLADLSEGLPLAQVLTDAGINTLDDSGTHAWPGNPGDKFSKLALSAASIFEAQGTEHSYIFKSDSSGIASIDGVAPGVYVAVSLPTLGANNVRIDVAPMIISVPEAAGNGSVNYDIKLVAKGSVVTTPARYKIVKRWVGDSNKLRPKSVSVLIARDGAQWKTIELSGDNNWSFIWDNDGANYSVAEKSVNSAYRQSISNDETGIFVLTNTYIETPPSDEEIVDTSDPSAAILTSLMLFAGALLILSLKLRRKEVNHG